MKTALRYVLNNTRYFVIPYLAILCVCLAVKIRYDRETVYYAINAYHSSQADYMAPYITDIGDGLTIILLSLLMLLFNYRSSFLLFTSYVLTSLVAQVLKYSIHMPRPGNYFKDKLAGIHFVKGAYVIGGIQSFPSGHTVTAFSAGVVLTYLLKNKLWGIALLLVAMFVGYSRIYLSEHFFGRCYGPVL